MNVAPVVFVNIGWMVHYKGISPVDPTIGGHGYLKTHTVGHESWNFLPNRGKLYGYVPREAKINLANLGGDRDADVVEGVTIVWVARHPSTGKSCIVGWYKNALVHREGDHYIFSRARGLAVTYQISTTASDGTLLSTDQRWFHIPTTGLKHMGQSPLWYGGSNEFRRRVLRYIASGGMLPRAQIPKSRHGSRSSDHEAQTRIERAAIRHATEYYESKAGGGRSVQSVESVKCGWDLSVTDPGGAMIKVEVKGLSGIAIVVELTHNEYKAMLSREHRTQYVIYIVTQADTKDASSHIFRYDRARSTAKKPTWIDDAGRELKQKPLLAARLNA